MAPLFDVSLRPSEPADQETSEAMLSTWKIRGCVHGSQKVVLRYLSIEGGDQACETFRTNHRINFEFLHVLCALLIELFPYQFLTKLPSHRFLYLSCTTSSGCNVPRRRDRSIINTKNTGTRILCIAAPDAELQKAPQFKWWGKASRQDGVKEPLLDS